MIKGQVLALLSTTAVILGISLSPISSSQLPNSLSGSGSSSPSTARSPLSTPFLAQRGGLARKQQVMTTFQALHKLAKEGDDDAKIALQTPDQEQAILKYNDILKEEALRKSMGTDALTKSETKIIKIARKKAGDSEEGMEKFAAQLEFGISGIYGEEKQDEKIEHMLEDIDVINSKLDMLGHREGSIKFYTVQYNKIRVAAGLEPINSQHDMIEVSKQEAKKLIEVLAREIAIRAKPTTKESNEGMKLVEEEGANEEVSIGKKLSLFIRNFPNLGESEDDDFLRDTALEEIMTLILLEPEGKEPIYNKLCFALEDFKTLSNYSPRLNKYAEYYEDQIKVGPFAKFYEGWLKEKEKISKNQTLELAGLCWNQIMNHVVLYADIDKQYHIKDTPLLTLIARKPQQIYQLLDIAKFQNLQELVKYTPYTVIGGVYSALTRSGIKERQVPEGASGRLVTAANIFLSALEDALNKGEQDAQIDLKKSLNEQAAEIKELMARNGEIIDEHEAIELAKVKIIAAKWDGNLAELPEKFKTIAFIISPGLRERFVNTPLTILGKFTISGVKKEEEERKKNLAFKLVQLAKIGYFGSEKEQKAAQEKQAQMDKKLELEKNEALRREQEEIKQRKEETTGEREILKQKLMAMHAAGANKEDATIVAARVKKQKEQAALAKAERERTDHIVDLINRLFNKEITELKIEFNKSYITGDKERSIFFNREIFYNTKAMSEQDVIEYLKNNKNKILNSLEIKFVEEKEGSNPEKAEKIEIKKEPPKEIKNPIDKETNDMKAKIEEFLPKINAATGNNFTIETLTGPQIAQIKNQVFKLENIETLTSEKLKVIITDEQKKTGMMKRFISLAGPLNS